MVSLGLWTRPQSPPFRAMWAPPHGFLPRLPAPCPSLQRLLVQLGFSPPSSPARLTLSYTCNNPGFQTRPPSTDMESRLRHVPWGNTVPPRFRPEGVLHQRSSRDLGTLPRAEARHPAPVTGCPGSRGEPRVTETVRQQRMVPGHEPAAERAQWGRELGSSRFCFPLCLAGAGVWRLEEIAGVGGGIRCAGRKLWTGGCQASHKGYPLS